MSIDAVGNLVYRKYLIRLKKLRDLADARRTMTLDERRELLINNIIRGRLRNESKSRSYNK